MIKGQFKSEWYILNGNGKEVFSWNLFWLHVIQLVVTTVCDSHDNKFKLKTMNLEAGGKRRNASFNTMSKYSKFWTVS